LDIEPLDTETDTAMAVARRPSGSIGPGHAFRVKWKSFVLYDLVSLVCVVLGVVFFFAPGSESYDEMSDHESGQVHLIVTQATLLILTGLVCVSLFFEAVQEYLEHSIHAVYRPVLNALNTELMGMGFLAIIVYFVLKSEVLLDVGRRTVCLTDDKYMDANGVPVAEYHCDEKIIHMFEDIHMSLFLVLVMFFARACLLLFQTDMIGDDWVEMENDLSIKGEHKIREEFDQVMSTVTSSVRERKDKQETYEFMLFKKRFVEQMKASSTGVDMDSDFSFADYLNICSSHIAQEVVEIPPIEWCALEVFFFFFWLGLRQPDYMRIRFFLAFAILLVILCFQLIGKVEWVLQQVVTPYPKPQTSSWPCFTSFKPGSKQVVHPKSPTAKPEPLFFQELHKGHHGLPSHVQEALFWKGSEHFTLHLLRFFMLTSMIFFVVLITIIPFASAMGSLHILFVILPVPFLGAGLTLVPHELLKDFTICTNVEFMKKPKIVEKVSRDIRIKKSLRAIKVLRSLQSQKFQKAGLQTDSTDTTRMDQVKVKELMELKRTFSVFDLDHSGSVDLSELGGLMQALGIGLDDDEKDNVMKEFDVSGDGNISFDEFFTYMNRRNQKIDPDEVIRDVFEMIDQDGSGTVSKLEFQSTLEKLGTGLKAREIEDLLREIDTGGDGQISLDEFSLVLRKYN
jgi:Ca2+-binding EF-hand superfamily protein